MDATYITVSQLFTEFPDFFLRTLSTRIESSYKNAAQVATYKMPSMRLQSLSVEQGLSVQDELYQYAEKFSEVGLEPHMVPNAKKRDHLEIKTKTMLVTTHRVTYPNEFPRPADYRRSNAASNQGWLSGIQEPKAPHGSLCNLYILHGPNEEDPSSLGFVQVAIPDSQSKSWLYIQTLFACESYAPVAIENPPKTTTIRLKTARKDIKKSS